MKLIRREINEIIEKKSSIDDNVLKNAPHTMPMVDQFKLEQTI